MRIAAAVVFAGLLAACAAPAPPATAGTDAADSLATWLGAARSEVQAAADGAVAALRRHDGEVSLALLAPDFEATLDAGEHLDREQYAASRRAAFERLVEVAPETRLTIGRVIDWTPRRPWEAVAPEVVFETHQHAAGTVHGDGGEIVPFGSDGFARETWRRAAGGWQRVRVVQLGS